MSGTRDTPDLQRRSNFLAGLAGTTPSWSQVLLIFVCSIPPAAIVTGIAIWLVFEIASNLGLKEGSDALYLLILVLSPGLYVVKFLRPLKTGWDPFDLIFFSVVADFVYYFCLVFVFSLWADRRWRRKRAARIDA
jgi:hypothetical protein